MEQDLAKRVSDWIVIAVKMGSLGLIIVYFKAIINTLKVIFFGEEGYDYREFTGVVAMIGFIGMLWKHFTDNTYVVSIPLLGACLLIIFVLAGIKEGVLIFKRYIGIKNESTKSVSKT